MKTTNKKKKYLEILATGILVIILCSAVSALIGLSGEYHDKNPVTIASGETKEVVFGRFQNTGEEEITLKIELVEGKEIATLTSENLDSFVLPAGIRNKEVKVKISIPENTPNGYKYKISINYEDITPPKEGGMIQFTESKTSSIPVLVKALEKPEGISISFGTLIISVIVVAVIAIIVTYFIVKKKQASVAPGK